MKKLIIVIVLFILGSVAFVDPLYMQEPDERPYRPKPTPVPTETSFTPQIVGGTLASPGEYPWQVALVNAGASNPYDGQYCGGSLIAPDWVLTAAHCVVDGGVVDPPSAIDVVVGILKLSSGPTNGGNGQRLDVAQVIPHPNYNEGTTDSDLALLRLATPATLNSSVAVVGLIDSGNANLANPGVMATITGWGNTLGQPTPGGTSYPDDLYKVSVPIVSNATCNAPGSYGGAVTANMFCAGEAAGGKDSCQGDSGGPVVVPDGGSGWLLAGIVSWGDGCAQPNAYGVYTRVWNFKTWIDLQIGNITLSNSVYLPTVIKPGQAVTCTPSPAGDSDNVNDALTVCNGQTVYGQVNDSDWGDVYKIAGAVNQTVTLTMSGTGVGGAGDADLYLFVPGTTDLFNDPYFGYSRGYGNNEHIQAVLDQSGVWYIFILDYENGDGGTDYALSINLTGP